MKLRKLSEIEFSEPRPTRRKHESNGRRRGRGGRVELRFPTTTGEKLRFCKRQKTSETKQTNMYQHTRTLQTRKRKERKERSCVLSHSPSACFVCSFSFCSPLSSDSLVFSYLFFFLFLSFLLCKMCGTLPSSLEGNR